MPPWKINRAEEPSRCLFCGLLDCSGACPPPTDLDLVDLASFVVSDQ